MTIRSRLESPFPSNMIFTTQRHPTNEYSSSHEKFLSITGLAAVIGVLGGAGLMIYGTVRFSSRSYLFRSHAFLLQV